MRTRRILVMATTVLATMLVTGLPAQAGAWEETLLDPPPARIEPAVTYTFGYWILQHGSYPYQGGDLGPTALVATDEKGTVVRFPGTLSATEGHYSAEVVFPHAGRWTIGSHHEVIMPDELVATVIVPGGVEIAPSMMTERAPWKWGEIRPSFPPPGPDAAMNAPSGPLPGPATALIDPDRVEPRSQTTATADQTGTELPGWLPIAGGVLVLGLAGWLVRRYRRSNA
jgi:LPXTG-motif cell wall-anchored protein